MKPRITLAETTLADGNTLTLQEHDDRVSLLIHGQQVCGPSTRSSEMEMARLACAPFRPVRQPKIWLTGLGLGHSLGAVCSELKQKRGTFTVAEPLAVLPEWHREYLPDSPLLTDPRVVLEDDCGAAALSRKAGELSAILLHLDASPQGPGNRPWVEDKSWLSAASESLQQGGLLAIAGTRPLAGLTKRLRHAGFDVAEYSVQASPGAKRSRLHPIWLARKGKPVG